MLTKAIDKWNIDVSKSFFIGDSLTDNMATKKIEIKFYYKDEGSLYKQISRILNMKKIIKKHFSEIKKILDNSDHFIKDIEKISLFLRDRIKKKK